MTVFYSVGEGEVETFYFGREDGGTGAKADFEELVWRINYQNYGIE